MNKFENVRGFPGLGLFSLMGARGEVWLRRCIEGWGARTGCLYMESKKNYTDD